jgi:peptidyl-prolyl cis-trans isomerase A (cyclophilin A)
MRSILFLILIASIAGCEKKASPPPPGGSSGGGATSTEEVRPPVPGDLAEYTKDLPGSGSKLMAKIETPLGTINCELFGDKAPATVANFIGLATGKKPFRDPATGKAVTKPYFDGLIFHRVIPTFMIQGGDPLGKGYGGPGYNFDDEIDRSLPMGPGALAMANAGIRGGHGTNGSQFFVMEGEQPQLVGKHTIFGQCKELEVVKAITGRPRNEDDRPNEDIPMKITISKG